MIVVSRGEIWFANLNPTRGSEQAGIRLVQIPAYAGMTTT